MSKAFNSIKQGLTEAIDHAAGQRVKAVIHNITPLDVKDIRKNVGMSQGKFAMAFGVSVATLRHWERGDRSPRGPALVLLNMISREPKIVMKILTKQS